MTSSGTDTFVVVRHCLAAGQEPTAGLTKAGVAQARRLAVFLADYPIDFIVTSGYARAYRTIEPYAERSGLPIQQDDRLNERVLASNPIANWEQVVRQSFDDPDLRAPGGESGAEVLRRAHAALHDIQGRTLPLLVSHGNLVAILLHAVDAGFGYQGWKSLTNPDVYLLSGFATPRPRAKRIWRPE